jgi:Uma2 family endonuclease
MTTIALPKLIPGIPGQHLVLDDVSWEAYELLLQQVEEEHFQLTYDEGRLEIMSPFPRHESIKQVLGTMVSLIAMERRIPIKSLGQTTFRRRKVRKGLEPDQCYYVQNEKLIRGRDDLDFNVDPPPDLVIEADITHRSIERMPLYAALGVPEIWRHDGLKLTCQMLAGRTYEQTEMSVAFPFLRVADLNQFVDKRNEVEETELMLAFRDWVRQNM